jgi:hypothetical protein
VATGPAARPHAPAPLAPGIERSPGSGAGGATLNKEGKSEHEWAARIVPQALPGVGPRWALCKESRELGLQDAELVAPWIAHDPEAMLALLLVAPPHGAECFKPADFSLHVVGFEVDVHPLFVRLGVRGELE